MSFRWNKEPPGIDKDGNPIKGNVDKTIHSGVELAVTYIPTNYLNLSGNLAWSKNYYKDFLLKNYDGTENNLSGNSIIGFPDIIGNFRFFGSWENLSGSLFIKYVGKQYLDNAFQEDRILDTGVQKSPKIDPFTRIDLMLDYGHDSGGEAAAWFSSVYLSENGSELWAYFVNFEPLLHGDKLLAEQLLS